MPLQKSRAPWAPSENDAQRLTAQLRASRLTVLCGDAAAPMTELLKAGVLPHLQRRAEDRAVVLGVLKRKVVRTPERRQRAAGTDTEVTVFFDQWQGFAREALMARLHTALKPRKAGKDNGQLPKRVGERLKLLSDRCGVRFLLVFDRFERCLLAPPESHDLRALREEIYIAINHGELHAQFLLSVREQGEPLLDRLRGRVRGFDATRQLMPIEGTEDRGLLTLSTVPLPQAASARTRTAQTGAVYASIEAMLEQVTRRTGPDEDSAPPFLADVPELPVEDATLLNTVEPVAPAPEADEPAVLAVHDSPADAVEMGLEAVEGADDRVEAAAAAPELEALAEPGAPAGAVDHRDHEADARAEAKLAMVIAMAEEAIAAAVAQQQPGVAASSTAATTASTEGDAEAGSAAEIGAVAAAAEAGDETAQSATGSADAVSADTVSADAPSADAPSDYPGSTAPTSRTDPTLSTLFTEASLSSFMSELDDVIERVSPPSQRAAGLAGVPAPDMQRWADEVSAYLDAPKPPGNAAVDEPATDAAVPSPASAPAPLDDSMGDDREEASPDPPASVAAHGEAPEPESAAEPPGGAPWSFDADAAMADAEPPAVHAESPADGSAASAVAPTATPAAAVAASPSSMLVVRGLRSPTVARSGAARVMIPPPMKRMVRTLVPLAAVVLMVGVGFWGLRGTDGPMLPWAARTAPPLAVLPIDSDPPAAGGAAVNGVPPIELVAPGPMALRLADELAQGFHPSSGPGLVVRGTKGWAEDLGTLRGAQRLAIARHDALQAARDDAAIGPLQIVMPLYAEELVFVVRDDSPLRYIHQIQGHHINTGDPGSARALTVRTAYEQLFASKLPEAQTSRVDEPEALKELLDRSTDVVALVGSVPGHWLEPQSLQGAGALRLLTLDRNHPASRRALRSLLPARLAVGVDGRPAAQPVPTLAMMSFLVAAGGSWGGAPRARPAAQDDEATVAIGTVTRTLCERLPALQRDGHPKWSEVRPAIPVNAGWPYSPQARRILRDCNVRASSEARHGTAAQRGLEPMTIAGLDDGAR